MLPGRLHRFVNLLSSFLGQNKELFYTDRRPNNHNAGESLILVSLKYRIGNWCWFLLPSWFYYLASPDCGPLGASVFRLQI